MESEEINATEEAPHVTRMEHFWMRRDYARSMLDAIERNNISALRQEYRELESAFAEAQRLIDEWRSPEEVFPVLEKVGIIGAGGPANGVSTLHSELAGGARAQAGGTFALVAGGVFRAVRAGMSLLRLVKKMGSVINREVASSGFLFNDALYDLRCQADHRSPAISANPYFYNSEQTIGPTDTLIPARGRVLDPRTEEEHDCVPMCAWATQNVWGLEGTFATMMIEHPVFHTIALGWGVPHHKPCRTILLPGGFPTAEDFFHEWDDGKFGPFRPHFSGPPGSSLIYEESSSPRVGRFGVVFRDIPSPPSP